MDMVASQYELHKICKSDVKIYGIICGVQYNELICLYDAACEQDFLCISLYAEAIRNGAFTADRYKRACNV